MLSFRGIAKLALESPNFSLQSLTGIIKVCSQKLALYRTASETEEHYAKSQPGTNSNI